MTGERAQPTDQDDSVPAAPDDGGLPPFQRSDDSVHAGTAEATDERPNVDPAPRLSALAPLHSLKLVVTLQAIHGDRIRALLAVGSDGYDPLVRATQVGDLASALDEAAALVAEAADRWRTRPRNPPARPQPKARPARTIAAPAALLPGTSEAENPETQVETGERDGPGQLSLFP